MADLKKADVIVSGPINGMGEGDSDGSYLRFRVSVDGATFCTFRVSRGQAELLAAEIHSLLTFDLDRMAGAVIDAYTLAPNDEDAKRDAVREAIQRGIRP